MAAGGLSEKEAELAALKDLKRSSEELVTYLEGMAAKFREMSESSNGAS